MGKAPKRREDRNTIILAEFESKEKNARQLAHQWHLTLPRIYKIIKAERRRRERLGQFTDQQSPDDTAQ